MLTNRAAMKRARQKFQRDRNVVSISEMEIDRIICGPNFRNHFLAINSVFFDVYATFFLDESLSLVYQFYETISFLFPPARADDRPLRLKSSSSLMGELQAHGLPFFTFLRVQHFFFSYALNDCCFHGESFRELSRKPFV